MFDLLSFDCSFLDCTHVFSMAQSPFLRTMEPQRTSKCSTHMSKHGTYSYIQPLLIAISCLGWATNHFTGLKFPGQNDVSSAAGAFAVGFVSNLYARFFKGNAFVIMVSGHDNQSWYASTCSLSLIHIDHCDPVPTAVGCRERRFVHLRIRV